MPDLPVAREDSRRLLAAAVRDADGSVRAAVRDALEGSIGQLYGPDPRARAARVAKTLGDALAGAVAQARAAAREASAGSLAREFAAAGGDPADLPDVSGGDAEDKVRGAAVGETFAAAWLAAFDAAYADGTDPADAAQRALDDVEDRVPRIAVTETAHAFTAERRAVSTAHARASAGTPGPTMVWVCRDGGDCLTCYAMCGTTRPFGVPWTVGEKPFVEELWPGQVHPNCACSAHVAEVPWGAQPTAKAGPVRDEHGRFTPVPADLAHTYGTGRLDGKGKTEVHVGDDRVDVTHERRELSDLGGGVTRMVRAGSAHVSAAVDHAKREVVLSRVHVDDELRRGGVATAMIGHVAAVARDLGYAMTTTGVLSDKGRAMLSGLADKGIAERRGDNFVLHTCGKMVKAVSWPRDINARGPRARR